MNDIRLPPAVHPGDRVGVAALSGPLDPERLDAGLEALAALGFEPIPARNLRSRHDLFAGRDAERLAGFHELVGDSGVKAIFFARGGHGMLRLLPGIDWALVARHPRAYVGYSDATPFLNYLATRLGLVSFHGPMIATDLARGLDDEERSSLLGALAGEPDLEIDLGGYARAPSSPVTGPLLGGCLSLIAATLGTRWAPSFGGSILLLEDVGEPLYRIDRMLTHLGLSGSLTGIRGIAIGALRGIDEPADRESTVPGRIAEALPDVAVAWGLPAGHAGPNRTFPLGATARLETGAARLLIEPPAPLR